jgi:hypothetical protein
MTRMTTYGRLEVFLPDVPVENVPITEKVIGVGRAPGNYLVLDRNGISRYHITITVEEQQASLMDLESVNGVYVEGIRIPANQAYLLRGGEEIQLADVRLVYHPPEKEGDITVIADMHSTQRIHSEQLRLFIIGLDSVAVPGSHVQVTLNLTNLSDVAAEYTLQVEGVPKEWVRLERTMLELEPQEQIELLATFKPLRRSETRPNVYPVTFTIMPKDKPEQAIKAPVNLRVGTFSAFGILMGTPTVIENQPFEVYLQNQGNDTLTLNLRARDPQERLDIQLSPSRLSLEAGQQLSVRGVVREKRRHLLGATRRYPFDVIAQSEDASRFQAPVSSYYISQPLLPMWLATSAIPLMALLAIVLIFFLASVFGVTSADPTPTPSATATDTSTPTTTPSPTLTPSNTPSPTLTPSNTPSPTLTPSNTPSPTLTPSNTNSPAANPNSSGPEQRPTRRPRP